VRVGESRGGRPSPCLVAHLPCDRGKASTGCKPVNVKKVSEFGVWAVKKLKHIWLKIDVK
jgi:hypothetical protein